MLVFENYNLLLTIRKLKDWYSQADTGVDSKIKLFKLHDIVYSFTKLKQL